MKLFEKYERIVEMSRKRQMVGTVECKFRPTTEYARTVFGKHIAVNVGKEEKGIKSALNEKNYAAAGFNQQLEISEWEASEPGYPTFKARIMNNFGANYRLHLRDFTVELGEFIPRAEVSELDFDDIPDLRDLSE